MIAIRDRVRFVETDMMGVVHHANYLRWFEMGHVTVLYHEYGLPSELLYSLLCQSLLYIPNKQYHYQ